MKTESFRGRSVCNAAANWAAGGVADAGSMAFSNWRKVSASTNALKALAMNNCSSGFCATDHSGRPAMAGAHNLSPTVPGSARNVCRISTLKLSVAAGDDAGVASCACAVLGVNP